MKSISFNTHFARLLLLTVFCVCGLTVFGQNKTEKQTRTSAFCSDNWSNGDKVSFSEVREMTLQPSSLLSVDSGRNGGIQVKGENRSDIQVKACVRTWGDTEQAAKSVAGSIRITNDSSLHTEGASEESNWSVSYLILVPRATNLGLSAFNGGISISGVDGNIEFKTTNGGVSLSDVSGDVKGRTTNGGVSVNLAGGSWRGSGLNVETTNGGVSISMPESYAAHIETRTVNGGYRSEIAALDVKKEERTRGVNISTDLNGGGALIRVITTNGGVSINTAKNL